MDFIQGMLHNPVLIAAVMGWFIAQVLKTIIHLMITKELVWERMVGSGGMPSSHSAVVTTLAAMIGKSQGYDTPIFAISVIFAMVVMYDAAGVRRAAGKQASLLNKLVQTPGLSGIEVQEKLVEVLGHTPLQVFVGAAIGIVVGLLA